jgi:DNA-binding response OmpR family regulator
MRILIFTEKGNLSTFKKYLEKEHLAKVDLFNDYEDAEYCADIRFYDIIYIYYSNKYKSKLMNFFRYANNKNENVKIILFGEKLKSENLELYNKYNLFKIIKEDLNFEKLKEESKEVLKENIEEGILKINVKEKKVWILKDNEHVEIYFKKKIDFYVFLYFMRHYKETINISNLLDATCEEPELTKDSIIESSISSLRKTFKELLGLNPIKAYKKVGYEFSIS